MLRESIACFDSGALIDTAAKKIRNQSQKVGLPLSMSSMETITSLPIAAMPIELPGGQDHGDERGCGLSPPALAPGQAEKIRLACRQ